MIPSRTTRAFREAFASLPDDVRRQAKRAYRLFRRDPRHPSLRFKKVDEEGNIYSVRVGLGFRALGVIGMTSFSVKTRVQPDGTLQVVVPTGLPESDVDVLLAIRSAVAGSENAGPTHAWPANFLDNTFRSLADESLVRPPQLDFEGREKLL